MYHHVVPADKVSPLAPFAVSADLFSRQLTWLQLAGFHTVTLGEFFDLREAKKRCEKREKLLIITFDDCPANLLEHAVPELIRRGMTATFFAVAGKPGENNDWDRGEGAPEIPLMSSGDLKSLADGGFEIGSHGMSHANLRKCSPEQIRWELKESREILEDTIGRAVQFLAYPYGEYPEGYAGYCREAGYRGAVSIFSPVRTVTTDPYCMRRVLVHEGDNGMRFRFKMSRLYQRLRYYVDKRVLRADG